MEELKETRKSGLHRLHVGLETGYDPLLKRIKKGATREEMVIGSKKAKEAGYELCEYVLLGLGGKEISESHAKATAEVINEINPDYVRFRTLIPLPEAPLYQEYVSGKFTLLSPHEVLREAHLLIERLDVRSTLAFDHLSNPIPFPLIEYKLPEEKQLCLGTVETALSIDESRLTNVKDLISSFHI